MKKRNYLSVEVKYFANDAIASIQIPMNEAESVAAQAEEHKDLRFHVTGDDGESIVVIPWEKVASVTITYDTTDVAAPHDDICGGEAGTLELTPSTVGTRSISYFPTEGDLPCSFSIFNIWTYFDGLTYNGNYVDIYTASEDPTFSYTVKDGIYDTESESWYIPHECGDTSIHAGDKKDVEFTVNYKGATATAVVECSIAVSQ